MDYDFDSADHRLDRAVEVPFCMSPNLAIEDTSLVRADSSARSAATSEAEMSEVLTAETVELALEGAIRLNFSSSATRSFWVVPTGVLVPEVVPGQMSLSCP